MILSFFCNYLNHHQLHIADELYNCLGKDFYFIATLPRTKNHLKGGQDYSNRPFCVLAGESEDSHKKAQKLALESDVCIFAANSQEYSKLRAKYYPQKLSFEVGERWFKHGILTFASPVFRHWLYNYLKYYHKANFFKLCCSSFTANDDEKLHAYKNRHYKWAYFTKVDENIDITTLLSNKLLSKKIEIMWCGRFLKWKHPDLPVKVARKLKDKGYQFHLSIYGDDKNAARYDIIYPYNKLESLINKLKVQDCVSLMGVLPNDSILKAMQKSSIFLCTSDKVEGWGVVVNESMINGCVPIVSDAVGCSSYLIKEGENGFTFRNCNLESLTEKIEWLLNHPHKMREMQNKAYQSIKDLWSPKHAVNSLLELIHNLQNDKDTHINEGPCSKS